METELRDLLEEHLKPAEKVLWTGPCLSRMGQQAKASGPTGSAVAGGILSCFPGFVLTSVTNGAGLIALPLFVLIGGILAIAISQVHPRHIGSPERCMRSPTGVCSCSVACPKGRR